jgi:hypothetical protein
MASSLIQGFLAHSACQAPDRKFIPRSSVHQPGGVLEKLNPERRLWVRPNAGSSSRQDQPRKLQRRSRKPAAALLDPIRSRSPVIRSCCASCRSMPSSPPLSSGTSPMLRDSIRVPDGLSLADDHGHNDGARIRDERFAVRYLERVCRQRWVRWRWFQSRLGSSGKNHGRRQQ